MSIGLPGADFPHIRECRAEPGAAPVSGADEDTDHRIALAARMTRQSVSAFVLGAARVEADRLLAEQDTRMPAEQFDALIASLDQADPAPSLRRLGARPAAFER